jgi:hypothetical protein
LRAAGIEESGGRVWIEKILWQTSLPGHDDASQLADGPLGDLLEYLSEIKSDEQALARLKDELADLCKKLPPELREGPDAVDLETPAGLSRLLDDAGQLLVGRLLARGGVS